MWRGNIRMLALLCRSVHFSSPSGVSNAFASKSLTATFSSGRLSIYAPDVFTVHSVAKRQLGIPEAIFCGSKSVSAAVMGRRARGVSMYTTASDRQRGEGYRNSNSRQTGGGRRRSRYSEPASDRLPRETGQLRVNVSPGTRVEVVQKQHQRTGERTTGVVSRLLTSSGFHPHGIKVMLSGGVVGRVQTVLGSKTAPAASSGIPADSGTVTMGFESSDDSSDERNCLPDGTSSSVLAASTTIGAGRRRGVPFERQRQGRGADPTNPGARASDNAVSTRQVRKFRADRVHGRSWSIEGGELVARGIGGEELTGVDAALDRRAEFVRGKAKRRKGGGRFRK